MLMIFSRKREKSRNLTLNQSINIITTIIFPFSFVSILMRLSRLWTEEKKADLVSKRIQFVFHRSKHFIFVHYKLLKLLTHQDDLEMICMKVLIDDYYIIFVIFTSNKDLYVRRKQTLIHSKVFGELEISSTNSANKRIKAFYKCRNNE